MNFIVKNFNTVKNNFINKIPLERFAFTIYLIFIFIYLLNTTHNSLTGLILTVFFLASTIIANLKSIRFSLKIMMTLCSFIIFLFIVFLFPPSFAKVTEFIYVIPMLYGTMISNLAFINFTGILCTYIIYTYRLQQDISLINSAAVGMVITCVAYSIITYLQRKLKEEKDKYFKTSITDSLTGLANLSHTLEVGGKYAEKGQDIRLLVMDLNHFKSINDTYGHLVGNKLLIQFSQLLKSTLRDLDCIVGRLGGDEFIVIAAEDETIENLSLSALINENVEKEIFKPEPDMNPIPLRCSIGETSSRNKSPMHLEELIHLADMEMYYNKNKNQYFLKEDKFTKNSLSQECIAFLQVLLEKDMYTYIHCQYTAQYAVALGSALNYPEENLENLYISGWVHDIGKILITNEILKKRATLTNEEYEVMKTHLSYTLCMLKQLNLNSDIINTVKYHHERWDGTGYPYGTSGESIPIGARILQLANAFSSMTTKSNYRNPLTVDAALLEIQENSGTQFDPKLSENFIELLKSNK